MAVSVLVLLSVLVVQLCSTHGFCSIVSSVILKPTSRSKMKLPDRVTSTRLRCLQQDEVFYRAPAVLLDGFFKESDGLSELRVLQSVNAKSRDSRLVVMTDNIQFARKRLVSPTTVYSGLLDNVQYEEVDTRCGDRFKQLVGNAEVLISYGITPSELQSVVASMCSSERLKRAVLAVRAPISGDSPEIDRAVSVLQSQSRMKYTVFKYAGVEAREEGLRPYRVVRNGQPLPLGGPSQTPELLSSGDLFRVLAEVVDLPKTFNQVYGIGPGTGLDAEIVTYMKSRGWSERVQVGLLVGDMMEVIEKRVEEENRRAKTQAADTTRPGKGGDSDEAGVREGRDKKFAGFFT